MKIFVLSVVLMTTAFALQNAIDEYYHLYSLNSVFGFTLYWMAIPFLVGAVGLASSKSYFIGSAIVVTVVHMIVYEYYASNGSTVGSQGAQHVHLLLAPVETLVLTLPFLIVYLCLERSRLRNGARAFLSRMRSVGRIALIIWIAVAAVTLVLSFGNMRSSLQVQSALVRVERDQLRIIEIEIERNELFEELRQRDPPVFRRDLEAIINDGRPFTDVKRTPEGESVTWEDPLADITWRFVFHPQRGLSIIEVAD